MKRTCAPKNEVGIQQRERDRVEFKSQGEQAVRALDVRVPAETLLEVPARVRTRFEPNFLIWIFWPMGSNRLQPSRYMLTYSPYISILDREYTNRNPQSLLLQ
jgi:hypothetical protein